MIVEFQLQPHRGDEVEAWIKRTRDEYPDYESAWGALDTLLDDYRLHADTGTSLDRDVSMIQQPLVERMEPVS